MRGHTINDKPLCPEWPNDLTYQRHGETDAIDPKRPKIAARGIMARLIKDFDHSY